MKFKPQKKYFHIGLTIFLTAIAIMCAYFLFFRVDEIKAGIHKINTILAPVFYGLIIAYLMTPLLNVIERRFVRPLFDKENWGLNNKKRDNHIRTISVCLTLLIVVMVLYLFFSSVIPQIYTSVQSIISQYSVYTSNLTKWLNTTMQNNPEIAKYLSSLINDFSSEADDFLNGIALPAIKHLLLPNMNDILTTVSSSVLKVLMFVWNIIIGLVISIYVLAGKEKFARGSVRLCYAFFERPTANRFVDNVRFTHRTFIGFLAGKVVDSLIVGILCYFCCLILKLPYALLVSAIVGVTNVIPFFGPYIGAIPSTIIILLVDPKKALTFIILIIILQQIDGNFIGPKILAQSTGITSFWIIFAITLFGGLFSVMGMIIGVPVTAVIISFVERITKAKLKKKELPEDPDCYLNVAKITDEGEIEPYVYKKPEKKKTDKDNALVKAIIAIFRAIGRFFIWIYNFIKAFFVKMSENKSSKEKKLPEENPVKTTVIVEDLPEKPLDTQPDEPDEESEESSADEKSFPDTLV
ncbi:MAG: AI-2E family transporter [Lachnospiraceae bacterium]|nr:AI-2E family transporter [Lachnospiraceae bacterium]